MISYDELEFQQLLVNTDGTTMGLDNNETIHGAVPVYEGRLAHDEVVELVSLKVHAHIWDDGFGTDGFHLWEPEVGINYGSDEGGPHVGNDGNWTEGIWETPGGGAGDIDDDGSRLFDRTLYYNALKIHNVVQTAAAIEQAPQVDHDFFRNYTREYGMGPILDENDELGMVGVARLHSGDAEVQLFAEAALLVHEVEGRVDLHNMVR